MKTTKAELKKVAAAAIDPVCIYCQKPATCYGRDPDDEEDAFACDGCCGHDCLCVPVPAPRKALAKVEGKP